MPALLGASLRQVRTVLLNIHESAPPPADHHEHGTDADGADHEDEHQPQRKGNFAQSRISNVSKPQSKTKVDSWLRRSKVQALCSPEK